MPQHRYSLQKFQSEENTLPTLFFKSGGYKLHVSILISSACTIERMTLHF